MADEKPTPSWIKDFEAFANEFKGETDRAAVILGAAHLDNYLRQLLEGFLLPAPSGTDELLEGDSPLSTFSSRINASYRLGLIDADFARALHLVRRIRNSFAHEISGVSLNSGQHKDRVRDLVKFFRDNWGFKRLLETTFGNVDTPATEFRTTVALMSIRLTGAVNRVKRVNADFACGPLAPGSGPPKEAQQGTPADRPRPAGSDGG